ncbi:polysaccharide export protein [Brevundimonas intermedia]|uniref:Polysaccharide export protein n=1 Tax=Brevundimonas intermedia TaxID=74315 RepID=A0A4Y9RVK7_9CAUL|nr:polysaccharide biosynthesis/export family protein [Brevundimonas intermedia]TFW12271.1 polysaccharide export protein [Brevundimonas intermedia]
MRQGLYTGMMGLTLAFALAGFAPQTVSDYRLASADKVRIDVFGEEALSGEFVVNAEGKVALPLIGEIPAAGLTVAQLQDAVAQTLRQGYLNQPRVTAHVMTYRPIYILGEVNRPGEYPYVPDLTALNAVATAQGFTYRANTRRIFVRRAGSQTEEPQPLTADTRVSPGDTLRIGERYF